METLDLDILRPEKKLVKIGGQTIDLSYIPCGITFDVDKIVRTLGKFTEKELIADADKAKIAFELSIQLCALFCTVKHPELDEEWWRNNADITQINQFAYAVQEALVKAYKGIESPQMAIKQKVKK